MELYKRIKIRREELGMSQQDLATKLGYKSRSSINKIELGENDIPQSKIAAFAMALETSEAWLMGLDVPIEPKNSKARYSKDTVEYFEKTTTFERQLNELGWNCEFIGNLLTQESHYVFSNGKLSFNVSSEDYHKFVNDSRDFFKVRIHTLLKKSAQQMFADNPSVHHTNAAHALPNATTEDKLHDEDIMNDDYF